MTCHTDIWSFVELVKKNGIAARRPATLFVLGKQQMQSDTLLYLVGTELFIYKNYRDGPAGQNFNQYGQE